MKVDHHVTNRQLGELLLHLGFEETGRDERAVVYQHSVADSLICLPTKEFNGKARLADVLSVEMHLIGRGHIEASSFEEFIREGVLPAMTS